MIFIKNSINFCIFSCGYFFNYFKVGILNTRDLILMTLLKRLKFRDEIKELLLYSLFLNYYHNKANNANDDCQDNPCDDTGPQWSHEIYNHFSPTNVDL